MTDRPPTFYLYGEPHRRVEDAFVHVEHLDDRSRPSEWTIQPHAHAELAHLFFLESGGGTMRAGAARLPCAAPCLMLMPAGIVHGFDWIAETRGAVVTLATGRLAGLAGTAPEATGLLSRPEVIALPSDQAPRVRDTIATLMQELGWVRSGHDAAVQAALLALLVIALRLHGTERLPAVDDGRARALVARLRMRIEERFRLREPIASYVAALGTSETALRVACGRIARSSPGAMLDQRTMVEARRALLFSDMTVSAIGYSLGFEDPAYFSRFFTRHVGRSPRRYRAEQRGARDGG